MRQDQLDGLATFVCVAELRGFSAAAHRLGVSPSAVSQTIRQLEARVGVPLFHRTTRSVGLTEAGQRFLDRVQPAVQELAAASDALADTDARPSGLLRLTVPRSAYLFVLQPILTRFLQAHPEVSLEVAIDNSLVDIVGLGFDAGIRFNDMVERDMVGVRVEPPLWSLVVAAPGYWARRGMPTHPRELLSHECIAFRFWNTGAIERWTFERDGEKLDVSVDGRLVLNDAAAMLQAAVDGIGVAYLVSGYADPFMADGRLVQALAEWSPRLPPLTLYYPDRRRVAPKLRALIEFLRNADTEAKGPIEATGPV